MNSNMKIESQTEIEQYLETHSVYSLFSSLLQSLIISQPSEPLDFLLKKLENPVQKRVFLIGPTGSDARGIALQLCDLMGYTSISVGDLLKKEVSKKSEWSQEIEKSIQSFEYVDDNIVNTVVLKHLETVENEGKNYILEGFPKTRNQALALQNKGIIPNCFILLKMEESQIEENCKRRFEEENEGNEKIGKEIKDIKAKYNSEMYLLHLKHLMKMYGEFLFQVDMGIMREDVDIIEEIARLIEYNPKMKIPKRAQQILIMGPPCSGKTTLARSLCNKYGFIYISTNELIKDLIARKGSNNKSFEYVKESNLIPDEIIFKILYDRLQEKDIKIQGFVIDGFPKNQKQIENIEDLKIFPNCIFLLDGNEEIIYERSEKNGENQEILVKRMERWKSLLKSIEENPEFSKNIMKVDMNLDETNILERSSFHLENY